jgi:hypothetical protein
MLETAASEPRRCNARGGSYVAHRKLDISRSAPDVLQILAYRQRIATVALLEFLLSLDAIKNEFLSIQSPKRAANVSTTLSPV